VVLLAISHGACPYYKNAIRDGFGDGGIFLRIGEHGGGIDGRSGALEGYRIFINDAEPAEPKVIHCPGDCSDIVRIPGANQDDMQVIELSLDGSEWRCGHSSLYKVAQVRAEGTRQ
jgi:hypothetical protein